MYAAASATKRFIFFLNMIRTILIPLPCSVYTIRLLVALGADLRAVDLNNNTVLHYSALNHNFAATKVLLNYNAPVDIQNNDVRVMSQHYTKVYLIFTMWAAPC